jgi:hypothetical protein
VAVGYAVDLDPYMPVQRTTGQHGVVVSGAKSPQKPCCVLLQVDTADSVITSKIHSVTVMGSLRLALSRCRRWKPD